MIADVWVVMAGATKTSHVIETSDTGDVDFRGVENRLSARDRLTIYVDAALPGKVAPSLIKVEDVRVECRTEWIVDAGKEVGKLSLQVDGASRGSIGMEIFCRIVEILGGEEAGSKFTISCCWASDSGVFACA